MTTRDATDPREPTSLADRHDALLVDLDGVVYVGDHPVPHAAAALARARTAGLGLAFVTNNASRPPADVVAHLAATGVGAVEGEVVTSSQVAARLVAERCGPGATVLAVGGPGVSQALLAEGLQVVTHADAGPAAVVQGYGADVRWADLAEATYAVHGGALWVVTNLDATLPTPRGLAPGNGALAAVVRTATGRDPLVAGKPEAPIADEAVRRLGARAPLVLGDRLDTDIALAVRAGLPSLLVLTGVATLGDVLRADPDERPTHVGSDLRVLHGPWSEPVRGTSGRWRCGSAAAWFEGTVLHVEGSGEEALRAGVRAVWSRLDDEPGEQDEPWIEAARERLSRVVTVGR